MSLTKSKRIILLVVALATIAAVALVVAFFAPVTSTGEPPEPITIGLPTVEPGWREVDHFSGSGDDTVRVTTQDRWRAVFSAAAEPDKFAELSLEVPGAGPEGLPLKWTASFSGKSFQDIANWNAPPGEFSIVIKTENIAAWAFRVEERPIDDYSGLIYSLRALVAIEQSGEISQPFFSVDGKAVTVNGEVIQVFEYPHAELASSEAARISPDGSSIGTTSVLWVDTPHFYKKGKMIVLYVGNTELTDLLEALLGEQIAGR